MTATLKSRRSQFYIRELRLAVKRAMMDHVNSWNTSLLMRKNTSIGSSRSFIRSTKSAFRIIWRNKSIRTNRRHSRNSVGPDENLKEHGNAVTLLLLDDGAPHPG